MDYVIALAALIIPIGVGGWLLNRLRDKDPERYRWLDDAGGWGGGGSGA